MKNLKIKFGLFSLLAILAASVFFTSCEQEETLPDLSQNQMKQQQIKTELDKSLKDYELIELDYAKHFDHVKKRLNSTFTINFEFPSQPDWEFTLIKDDISDMYSKDFKVYEITADEQLIERKLHDISAYQGRLKNAMQDSYFTFALGRLEGSIIDENGEEYYIESLINYDKTAEPNQYVMYKAKDVIILKDAICTQDKKAPEGSYDGNINMEKSNYCWITEVTSLGDYKFYNKFGNNWNNTINWMWNRWYFAAKSYWQYNGYPMNWTLKALYQYTFPNSIPSTYWNGTTFVQQYNDYHYYSWYNQGDVNMLWTGYDVSGVWGQADGIGQMCKSPTRSYCFGEKMPNNWYSNNLMSHEIGHSMGMYHDDSSNNFMHSWYQNWNNSLGYYAWNNLNWHLYYYNYCLGVGICQ